MAKRFSLTATWLVLAAVLFNGWIFGWLNHGTAGYLQMSISELEVPGQPWSLLFNTLDFTSGLFMALGFVGLCARLKKRFSIWLVIIACLVGSLGLLTLFDVANPLDCVRYHNPVCVSALTDNHVSHTQYLHNTESYITSYVSGFLALAVAIWLLHEKQSRTRTILAFCLFAGIFISLEIMDNPRHLLADSIAERLWNLLVCGDLILLAVALTGLYKKGSNRR